MLAVEQLSAGWRTIIYGIAFLLFLAGGIGVESPNSRISLTSLGLALFSIPVLWDSYSLT
jgi:hypothetical protein